MTPNGAEFYYQKYLDHSNAARLLEDSKDNSLLPSIAWEEYMAYLFLIKCICVEKGMTVEATQNISHQKIPQLLSETLGLNKSMALKALNMYYSLNHLRYAEKAFYRDQREDTLRNYNLFYYNVFKGKYLNHLLQPILSQKRPIPQQDVANEAIES